MKHISNYFKNKSPLLFLAPMEGITNYDFRSLIEKHASADVFATEFIRITGPRQKVAAIKKHKAPLQVQFMASNGDELASCISFLKQKNIIDDSTWIDLNVGCPSKRVNAHGAGAALLCKPDKLIAMIEKLRAVHSGTLSVKTRVGYQSAEDYPRILAKLKYAPLDFITIHARTKKAGYKEPVNLHYLQEAVQTLPYPVVGNGEINSAEDALHMLQETGVKGLMCGRGAIRNPFLFSDIRDALQGKKPKERREELINFALELIECYQENPKKIGLFKEFAFWLSRNPSIGKEYFDTVKRMLSFEDIKAFNNNLLSVGRPGGQRSIGEYR